MQHLDQITRKFHKKNQKKIRKIEKISKNFLKNFENKIQKSNEWLLYGILTLPPLENMKNINSTGSCYDSIPESFRKKIQNFGSNTSKIYFISEQS